MKKKTVFWIFNLLVILVFVSACSSSPTQQRGENSNNNNTKSEDTIVLKSSIQSPKESSLTKGFDAYLDEIEKQSNGRIKFERYYSESLVKVADTLEAVGTGIADIALLIPGYTPAKNPLATIESLPALWENQWPGTMAYRTLFEKYPQLGEEFEKNNVKVVGHANMPSYYIISNKEAVNSFDDLKGLKMIASGNMGVLADAMGATPVGVVITESYEAMEKGTVDGAFLGLTSSSTYGMHELAKSVWKLPIGSSGLVYGMNLNTYNELSDDLKEIIDNAALKNISDFHKIYQEEGETASLKKYEEAGVEIIEPTQKDIEDLQKLAKNTIWKKWIDEESKMDYPAEEILDTFLEDIKKYEEEFKQNGLPE